MQNSTWDFPSPHVRYTNEQQIELDKLTGDLKDHMKSNKHRLEHSLSVARTAEYMAVVYSVDPYLAVAASLLHDWDKILTPDELIAKAREQDLDMGVSLTKIVPLLHGIVAASTLRERYPELPDEVFQAIERHTIGAADMTPLDMVVFIADGIEPRREAHRDIVEIRDLVGKIRLPKLYLKFFEAGMCYVIRTSRYLYPGTVDIYNELIEKD